ARPARRTSSAPAFFVQPPSHTPLDFPPPPGSIPETPLLKDTLMKIGFLDYKLNNYHMKKFHGLLTGPVGNGRISIVAASELEPTDEGRDWCAQNGIPCLASAEEVIAASDALLVLAPNNPETHLAVARPALASGKPVF